MSQPRLPHLGRYIRDRYTEVDLEKRAQVNAKLAAVTQEDLEKVAFGLNTIEGAAPYANYVAGKISPSLVKGNYPKTMGDAWSKGNVVGGLVSDTKDLGKAVGQLGAGAKSWASKGLSAAGKGLSGLGSGGAAKSPAAPKPAKPASTPKPIKPGAGEAKAGYKPPKL